MPRRAKSEVVALRLPLEVHALAVAEAAQRGISIGALIGEIVTAHLDGVTVYTPFGEALYECRHPGSELVILPQGMRRCGRCYAVRGADGVWRRRDPEGTGLWLSESEGTAGGDTR